MSLRQMSQASTPASGSTTTAFSRPRPRTCRAGQGRRGEGEAGSDRGGPEGAGTVRGMYGREAVPGCSAARRPATTTTTAPLHPPTHPLDQRAADVHQLLAEDGPQAGGILSQLLLNQHLQHQGSSATVFRGIPHRHWQCSEFRQTLHVQKPWPLPAADGRWPSAAQQLQQLERGTHIQRGDGHPRRHWVAPVGGAVLAAPDGQHDLHSRHSKRASAR